MDLLSPLDNLDLDLTPLSRGPSPSNWSGHPGRPSPGILTRTRLPTHRGPGRQAGVTVGTVTRAYTGAGDGPCWPQVGHGAWVRAADPANEWVIRSKRQPAHRAVAEPPGPAGQGRHHQAPAHRAGGGSQAACLAMTKEAGPSHSASCLSTGSPSRASRERKDRLLFSHGAQHGIMLALLATGCVGETLFCEGLSYPGMLGNARQLRIRWWDWRWMRRTAARGAGCRVPYPPGQAALPHPHPAKPHHGHHEPGATRRHRRHRPSPRSADRRG